MATKKGRPATAIAAEAKVEYRTRPKRRKKVAGEQTQPPWAEVFWLAFQQLTKEDQGAFLRRLLEEPGWFEDIYDSIMIIQSRNEPTRPFEEFEEDLKREGLA